MNPSAGLTGEGTVTQRLIGAAAGYGTRAALAHCSQGEPYTYASLAATIQRAAAGLAGHGLRARDIVAVYVPDAVCHVLACHAISAAGGVPCPVSHDLAVAEIAAQLARSGTRMLLTAPPLAPVALAAADRSWVRQVICFGTAPGTTPFSSLLGRRSQPPAGISAHDLALLPYCRRDDGGLDPVEVTHGDMAAELARLARQPGICQQDVVLAAPPAGDGRSYTTFLHHALLQGAKVVAAGAGELAAAAGKHHVTAAIAPPGVRLPGTGQVRLFAVTAALLPAAG
jgi:acyl-CoA synthetase (AMP-forming)/AMP-acid ligase II